MSGLFSQKHITYCLSCRLYIADVNVQSHMTTNPNHVLIDFFLEGSGTGVSGIDVDASGVHGVGAGDVVGTTLGQVLTNKTLGTGTVLGVNLNASSFKVTNLAAATASGDALSYGQSGAQLNGLSLNSQKITSLAPGASANDAVNKGQLDAVSSGIRWHEPVAVLNILSDAAPAVPGAPPVGPVAGDAYVVNTWGGGHTDGDIEEYDGAAWQVVVAGAAGEPPDGTLVLVAADHGAGAGSFNGEENNVGAYDLGTSAWIFTSPDDGDARLVSGDGSYYEFNGYTYDTGTTSWVQFTGAGQINAGDGLTKDGNTLNVGEHNTGGINVGANDISANVDGVTLEVNGTAPGTIRIAVGAAGDGIAGGGGSALSADIDTAAGLKFDGAVSPAKKVQAALEAWTGTQGGLAFGATGGVFSCITNAGNPNSGAGTAGVQGQFCIATIGAAKFLYYNTDGTATGWKLS